MLFVLLAIVLASIGADQLTKALIFGHDMAVIPGFIRFTSVENHGMVWGIMNGASGLMAAVTVFTAAVIAIMVFITLKYRKHMSVLMQIALAAVVGGAIGNLIDRIALGFVRDFICTEFIEFPVFNVADILVTCGAILLGILLIFTKNGHDFMNAVFPDEKVAKRAKER